VGSGLSNPLGRCPHPAGVVWGSGNVETSGLTLLALGVPG
jgi:hypothetical protein